MRTKLSVFTRIGGKFSVRETLADMIPDFDTYVEPFAGGGQVFLEVKSRFLKYRNLDFIISDTNDDIYSIWNALCRPDIDVTYIEKFSWACDRDRFYKIRRWSPRKPEAKLCRALYLFFYSYSGTGRSFAQKPYNRGEGLIRNLRHIRQHMRDVIVKNQDYNRLLKDYDSPTTVFYLDPPYSNKKHLYENQDIDMNLFERRLRKLTGKFVLSIDDSVQHRKLFRNYNIYTLTLPYSSGKTKQKRQELVITNFKSKT